MEKKFSVEELEKRCLEAEQEFKDLHNQLIKARKEEEEAKNAKLKAEREARYKEVIGAYENFEELKNKYVDDYGSFTFRVHATPHWWF